MAAPQVEAGHRLERLSPLDSLRGIAALSVVFHHALLLLPVFAITGRGWGDPLFAAVLKYTPLHVLFDGGAAVTLFFVLSGYVLSIPFHAGRPHAYRVFVIRRVARIWPPYFAVICSALMLRVALTHATTAPRLSAWFNAVWRPPITPGDILQHGSLIASFNDDLVDPVVWSLVHEMRISLVFPLLMLLIRRLRWQTALAAALSVAMLAFIADHRSGFAAAPDANTSPFLTCQYLLMFAAGALLARRPGAVRGWFRSRTSLQRALWLPAALTLYCSGWLALGVHHSAVEPFTDWLTTIGAAMLVVLALHCSTATAALMRRPLLSLGRISYSLYLVHAVVIVGAVRALSGLVPLPALLPPAIALSIPVATASHRWLERPAIGLGRWLGTKAVTVRPAVPSTPLAPTQGLTARGPS